MEAKYTIGYIDENDQQFKLYKRKLKEYGFKVIGYKFKKRMKLKDLMEQVYKSKIDLLMIDYKLKESNIVSFNGEKVERDIYETKPRFPHIIFTNKVDQAEPFIDDWKLIFDKDEIFGDKENVERFITILTKSIEQYQNFIAKKKKLISDLLEKQMEKKLSAKEKNLLLETQEELLLMDKSKPREAPKQLTTKEKLEDLSKTRIKAEKFLQSLLKKKK